MVYRFQTFGINAGVQYSWLYSVHLRRTSAYCTQTAQTPARLQWFRQWDRWNTHWIFICHFWLPLWVGGEQDIPHSFRSPRENQHRSCGSSQANWVYLRDFFHVKDWRWPCFSQQVEMTDYRPNKYQLKRSRGVSPPDATINYTTV